MSYAQFPKNMDAIALGMGPLTDAADDKASAQREMPKYVSHKQVWALRIKSIDGFTITPEDAGYAPFEVDGQYLAKHVPHVGGYYVVYADGYKSFSPAKAFEDGYTRI
jgi:hypothetical protein